MIAVAARLDVRFEKVGFEVAGFWMWEERCCGCLSDRVRASLNSLRPLFAPAFSAGAVSVRNNGGGGAASSGVEEPEVEWEG